MKKLKHTIIASFQLKIGWKMPRNRKNKNYQSVPFRSYTTRNRKFEKKIAKKLKKFKNSFMASFQAKIGLKMPRMRENKNYRSVPFRPDAKFKIPKK